MVILHNLYDFKLPIEEMVEIYIMYIRSVLESSAVVWHSSITKGEEIEIERVQKVALRIILKENYECYDRALNITSLETLKERRTQLCQSFAQKCTKNENTKAMFPLKPINVHTRDHDKYFVQHATTARLANSAIPYMQRLLNQ